VNPHKDPLSVGPDRGGRLRWPGSVLGIVFLKESSDLFRLVSISLIVVGIVGLRISLPG
jgi:hypothetical protein